MHLSKEMIINIRAIKFASHQRIFAARLEECRANEMRCFSMKRRWQVSYYVRLLYLHMPMIRLADPRMGDSLEHACLFCKKTFEARSDPYLTLI